MTREPAVWLPVARIARIAPMAFIPYLSDEDVPDEWRVPDTDHIIRIHGVHPETMKHHYDMYVELMRRPGPLSRVQRETIAVTVSAVNHCHY